MAARIGGRSGSRSRERRRRAWARAPRKPADVKPGDGRRQAGGRIRNSSGAILGNSRAAYMNWLDAHDARVLARPDPPVRIVSESGKTGYLDS